MSLGYAKEALFAEEGRPGEKRDSPCPTRLHSKMGEIFQAGQKRADINFMPPKRHSSPCIASYLSFNNNCKRAIPTHSLFIFRPMMPGDSAMIRTLHEHCLPVRYKERFFNNACRNVITRSSSQPEMPIFTQVAIHSCTTDIQKIFVLEEEGISCKLHCQDGLMVGAITAQMSSFRALPENECVRPSKPDLFPDAMYILTLCTLSDYRRQGIGCELLWRSIAVAQANASCGVVFLHVITQNEPAIKFYEKQGFELIVEIPNYYVIEEISYSCLLYAKYINGAQQGKLEEVETLENDAGEKEHSLYSTSWSTLRDIAASVWHMFTRWGKGEKKPPISDDPSRSHIYDYII
eukprot:261994_1